MPTYQYACTACGERLEAVQSFTDAPLTQCPACAGSLRKVFSAVGVVFKGSGFYKNDSRDAHNKAGTKKAEPAAGGSSSGGSSSGGSSSSDAKPAAADAPAAAAKPAVSKSA